MSKRPKKIISMKGEKKSFSITRIYLVISIILFIALMYFRITQGSDAWHVSDEGILTYPENRGKVDVEVMKTESGQDYILKTISFSSKDYTVEGLLRIPAEGKKLPAVVILPGATVPKEGTQTLAEIFSKKGYASIGIEQRNRGGVDMKYDYDLWNNKLEPVQHKMVFDALRAADVLRQEAQIDPERIAIVGESNGGRFAIIAAAIDTRIRGVIGISTSGYDTEAQISSIMDTSTLTFYRSIDPDTYLMSIPPRKIVMIHSINDTIIPIQLAENTFNKAKEPKQFYSITAGMHGYSEDMQEPLETELERMLE